MPKGFCKCRTNQIGLRNTITGLANSRIQTKATVTEAAGGKLRLMLGSTDGVQDRFQYDMARGEIGLKAALDDEFRTRVSVISQSEDRSSIEVYSSPSKELVIGDVVDWIFYAQPLEQSFDISAVTLRFAPLSDTGTGYKRSSNMENDYE